MLIVGSSPRMRGTPGGRRSDRHKHRFIPAYAGNAVGASPTSSVSTVHPRVCGERFVGQPLVAGVAGSSPRMRGTLRILGRYRNSHRFIPAYAGNAVFPSFSVGHLRFIPAYAGNAMQCLHVHLSSPVHPRVCGERSCWMLLKLSTFSMQENVPRNLSGSKLKQKVSFLGSKARIEPMSNHRNPLASGDCGRR